MGLDLSRFWGGVAVLLAAGALWFAAASGAWAQGGDYDRGGGSSRSESRNWRGGADMDWLWEPRSQGGNSQGGRSRVHSRARSRDEERPPHLRRDSAGDHSRSRSVYERRKETKSERSKSNRDNRDDGRQDNAKKEEPKNASPKDDPSVAGEGKPKESKSRESKSKETKESKESKESRESKDREGKGKESKGKEQAGKKEPAAEEPASAQTPGEPSQDYRPKKDVPKTKRPALAEPQPGVEPKAEADVEPKGERKGESKGETKNEPKVEPAAAAEPGPVEKPADQATGPGNYPILDPEKDAPLSEETRSVARQVLTLIRSSQDNSVEAELAKTYKLEAIKGENVPLLDARMQLYRIKDGRTVDQVVSELVADARVMAVQPNYIYRHQGTAEAAIPPDGLKYDHAKLQVAEAHHLAKGKGVLVAVIDSAIDFNHPGLAGAISDAYDAAGGGKDGENKDGENDVHGTAVAGVIRGVGVAPGVAPEAKILAVRAFAVRTPGKEPEATTQSLIRGVQWAIDRGARVLNLSFTGPEDPALQSMLAMARIRKAVVVAAAGNGGPNAAPAYPGAYPEVIAVTALDRNDQVYDGANHGRYIAVAAPGVQILAPSRAKGYAFFTGSSFAAAQVSGVAALMLEKKKDLDPATVRDALIRSAESFGPDADGNAATGAGRVNAAAALKALEQQ